MKTSRQPLDSNYESNPTTPTTSSTMNCTAKSKTNRAANSTANYTISSEPHSTTRRFHSYRHMLHLPMRYCVMALITLSILLGASVPASASSTTKPDSQATDQVDKTVGKNIMFPVHQGKLYPSRYYGTASVQMTNIWDLFAEIAGSDVNKIVQFRVYNNLNEPFSAYVQPTDDPNKWILGINLIGLSDADWMKDTMVHEYGHILTLSAYKPLQSSTSPCKTVKMDLYSCASPTSDYYKYYKQFWQKYGKDAPANEGSNEQEVANFYRNKGGVKTFVTSYAATNVAEDMAETWMTFVINPLPTGTPQTTVDKKLQFFADNPKLTARRLEIRQVLEL
ncbi:hypothetical protein [Paenibacillus sp. WLX2291]|uniref:hypothetical protein n=1 Tax=Paenibacillus sp. WLX2291 TaxID=3296934 RepID=UPI00398460D6